METLGLLEDAEIDVMVEKHGLPLMMGELLKKEWKAEPEDVKRKEMEKEQNRGKAEEEEWNRKAAEGERKSRREAEHAERKHRKVKQKSVFLLVIHTREPQKRWSEYFHAAQDTDIVRVNSSLAQAKRLSVVQCIMSRRRSMMT